MGYEFKVDRRSVQTMKTEPSEKRISMSISVPISTVESYFSLMQSWDADSKKNLIIRLVESLEPKSPCDFSACFGAWQDDRDADEIVREIYESRQNSTEIEDF